MSQVKLHFPNLAALDCFSLTTSYPWSTAFFFNLNLQEQPNLRTRLDDTFLLRFLRARKFDYDRALQLLLNYHGGRKAWPEVFKDLKPSTVKHVLDLGFLTVLPQPDPNGRYILCLRPGWCQLQLRIWHFLIYCLLQNHYSVYCLYYSVDLESVCFFKISVQTT